MKKDTGKLEIEVDETFNELMSEYLMLEDENTWYSFLDLKGVEVKGVYSKYAKDVEKAKEQRVLDSIGRALVNANLSSKLESTEIDIAKGQIIAKTIQVIDDTDGMEDPYKRIQTLQRANDILNTKGAGRDKKIMVRLDDMLEPEDRREGNKPKIARIGDI